MKNWNYINGAQVGNRTSSEIEKEIAEVESSIDSYHRAGENPPKNLEDRLKRLKAELANAKTGNSTEKLFEGLAKDVEEKEEEKTESIEELEKTGNSSVSGGTFESEDGSKKAVIDINPQSGNARVVWFEDGRQNGSSDYRSVDLATAAVKRKGLKKVGNSASDDKFAYVMREFEEGKLKTPDGKVVTDPQQAKAIAYSESKKTENGLARARNAIKKNS